MWNIYSLLVTLLETYLLFLFAGLCLKPKSPARSFHALIAATLAAEALQQFNILYTARNTGLLVCLLLDLAVTALVFQGKRAVKLCAVLFFYMASLTVEIWVIAAFSLLPAYSLSEPLSGNGMQVAATLVSKAVILVLGKWLDRNRTLHSYLLLLPQSQAAVTAAACGQAMLLLVFTVPIGQPVNQYRFLTILVLGAAGLFACCLLIPAVSAARHIRNTSERQRSDAAEADRWLLHYHRHLKAVESQLNSQEHDLRHQLSFTAALLSHHERDQPGASPPFSEMNQPMSENGSPWRFTGNLEADAVIHSVRKAMTDNGVALTVSGVLSPSLPVRSLDLCLLLSNLLENALEAAANYSGSQEKSVQLTVNQTTESLFISVINPVLPADQDFSASKKNLRRVHGYGLKRIKEIVNKYDGTLEIDQKEEQVQFHIYLKLGKCTVKEQEERRS